MSGCRKRTPNVKHGPGITECGRCLVNSRGATIARGGGHQRKTLYVSRPFTGTGAIAACGVSLMEFLRAGRASDDCLLPLQRNPQHEGA